MMTFHQVMKKTNAQRRADSAYVKLLKTKAGYNDLGQAFFAAQSYSSHKRDSHGNYVRNRQPSKYVTVVTFLDRKLHVNISCSCSDHLYRWEWALFNKDAADIEYSDGSAPDTSNPNYRPACCKHVIAIYNRIRSKLKP